MTIKVEFYILEANQHKSLHFSCQLLEKMYQEEKRTYVHFNSREEADRLDGLLWTYREDSFLPHQLYDEANDCPPLIQLGFSDTPISPGEVLLNLSEKFPIFYQRFNHVIEIVFTNPVVQQLARERYRQYREEGCEIITHKLNTNE